MHSKRTKRTFSSVETEAIIFREFNAFIAGSLPFHLSLSFSEKFIRPLVSFNHGAFPTRCAFAHLIIGQHTCPCPCSRPVINCSLKPSAEAAQSQATHTLANAWLAKGVGLSAFDGKCTVHNDDETLISGMWFMFFMLHDQSADSPPIKISSSATCIVRLGSSAYRVCPLRLFWVTCVNLWLVF